MRNFTVVFRLRSRPRGLARRLIRTDRTHRNRFRPARVLLSFRPMRTFVALLLTQNIGGRTYRRGCDRGESFGPGRAYRRAQCVPLVRFTWPRGRCGVSGRFLPGFFGTGIITRSTGSCAIRGAGPRRCESAFLPVTRVAFLLRRRGEVELFFIDRRFNVRARTPIHLARISDDVVAVRNGGRFDGRYRLGGERP